MRFDRGNHWSFYLFFVCLICIAVGGVELLHSYQLRHLRGIEQQNAKEELSVVRSRLESLIVSDIYVVNSLSTLVAANPEVDLFEWNKLATNIIQRSTHINVVGLAPDDVVKHIYPLKGNERVLGLDYRTVPKQWRSIQKAREIEETLISGPVELVQGGKAFVARVPIFTDPPFNQHYWGVCSVVIGLKSLFQDAGIYSLTHKYHIAIRGTDSKGESGEVFFGKQSTFDDAFSTEHVHFPYGDWMISIAAKENLLADVPAYQRHGARVLGYGALFILLSAFFAIFSLYRRANKRALHDELTGLPNRRYFMFTLRHQFEMAAKSNGVDSFALLNIDLDKFKAINDNFGHSAGDKVLQSIAKRIQGALRASDVVARIGGDEFLVLLPRVSKADDVDAICVEVEKALSHTPVIYEQQLINLRVSVGYALYKVEFSDVEEMLRVADARMYEVKKSHTLKF
ncbi:diguanylate cyclase [Vibrio sp. LaRot3]|uniref:diguanylate cyclase n=1 Tax=Vibrio sp. LaRot3 TaxID=2998829 RepID=UPI0022CDEC34|nr:diguanylate cyclase [Vibrio sp. LaRot3]MDA0150160.1 diguanylate cyclase [Vibrio sp. LaRot3]